jgi:hypothetical protein
VELSFLWCWDLHTSEKPGKFSNVVLERDGEDQTERSSDEVLRRSRRKGISCLKQEKGKLTGLVTSCVETAF